MPAKKITKRPVRKVPKKSVIKIEVDECCTDKPSNNSCSCSSNKFSKACTDGGGVYWVGFIGAAIYYISTAPGFWIGFWGVIKAMVWPALVVFKLMKFLGM